MMVVLRWFVAAVVAVLLSLVWTQDARAAVNASGGALVPITNGFQALYNGTSSGLGMARNYTATQVGNVNVTDVLSRPTGPAGSPFSVNATRTIPWAEVASGAARALSTATAVAGAGYAGWVVGTGIYNTYQGWGVVPSGAGGLNRDLGLDEVQKGGATCKLVNDVILYCGIAGWGARMQDQYPHGFTYAVTSTQTFAWGIRYIGHAEYRTTQGGPWMTYAAEGSVLDDQEYTIVMECPSYVDAAGVFHAPGDAQKRSGDGKCPGGQVVPITPSAAGELLANDTAAKTIAADIVRDAVNNGVEFTPSSEAPTVTGPASQTGTPTTSTSTTTNPNGETITQTTTKTPTYNYTYTGDTVTYNVTNSSTTTTVNNTTNETTTQTTNEDGTDTTAVPTDPDLPPVPDLYEQQYPDGLAGVWQSKAASFQNTPLMQFVGQLAPDLGDGGCPIWTIPQGNVLGLQVGGDVSIPCYVWSFMRLVIIISALLLCRALIFGG